MLASNRPMHQNVWLELLYFIGQKASASSPRPPSMFYFPAKLCMLLFISKVCLKHKLKLTVSSLIFQKFSREGLTEPPPQTHFPFFSRASPSVWASPSNLRRFAFDSGFTLDSLALRALDSGFALNFRLENVVWPPK